MGMWGYGPFMWFGRLLFLVLWTAAVVVVTWIVATRRTPPRDGEHRDRGTPHPR